MSMIQRSGFHPLPASPIKGEVPLHSFCLIQFQSPAHTSSLMGEVGRGCSHTHVTAISSGEQQ
jgi:hypothetical protein